MTQPGTNGFDPTTVKRFLGEAMRVYEKLDAAKIDHMNNCREIRAPLKDIKKAVKKHDAASDNTDLRPRFLQEKDTEKEHVESSARRLRSGISGLPGADAVEA